MTAGQGVHVRFIAVALKGSMYRRVFIAFLIAVGFAGMAAPSLAQPRFMPGHYYSDVRPLGPILQNIRNRYPGRFYDAEGPYPDNAGGLYYRIKWMTPDGRIIWLNADARSGSLIGPARNNWRQGPPAPPPPVTYGTGAQFGYGAPPGRFPGGGFRPGGFRGGWGGHPGRPH